MNQLKKAFAYARISGAHTQTELSIKEQLIQIHRYAEKNGITIEKEYSEVCSAFRTAGEKKLTARKVFFDMLKAIWPDIEAILIFRYDRASRTGKEFVLLEDKCSKHGVEIISITESFGQEHWPLGNFLVRNSINLSQLYSEELSFKCKLGMRRALKEGKLPWSVLPIGYIRLKKNVAIVDEINKGFIQEAFRMYATGNETYMSIAEELRGEWFRNKKGVPIQWKDVESILKNETYTGCKTVKWDLKKYELPYYDGATKAGTFTERYKLNIEPIISEELYVLVTKIRDSRSKYAKTEPKSRKERRGKQKAGEHIFSQLVECVCGRHFVGQYNRQKGIMYYGCSRSVTKRFSEKCHEPYIQEEELFHEIKGFLKSLYLSPASLAKLKSALDTVFSTDERERERTIETNRKKIEELEEKRAKLTEKYVEGKIPDENYELLDQKYRDEKILLEIENDRCTNFEGAKSANRKIFAYYLWTNWLLEAIFERFTVRVTPVWRTKLKWTHSNLILRSKKPLTYAVNGPLDFVRNDWILNWLRRYESNVRPQGYEPCELPLLYSAV